MLKNTTAKNIAGNTIYQFIGKLVTLSITVFATILITRTYGREDYGAFSLMQSWPALVFIIVDFGFNAIATRELSKDFSKAGEYITNILILRFLLSGIFILLMWLVLAVFPYSDSLKMGIRLSLFLIITQSLFTTFNIIFQTKMRYDLATKALVSGYLVIFALIVIFSRFHLPILWISFSYVLGGLLTVLISWNLVKKLGVTLASKIELQTIKYLFWQSLPLGIMFVFSQMNFKEDEILLSILHLPQKYGLNNTESVAVYALPYKVFEVALVVPTYFMNSVYPVMVRHLTEGKEKLKSTYFRSVTALIFAGILFGIIGILLSPFAIKILGGSEFRESVPVLQILLGGLIFYYLTQPFSWLIVTLEKQKYLPYIYLVAAFFNLAINLILIPRYSFYGAAAATHISELLILLMLIFTARKAWNEYYA